MTIGNTFMTFGQGCKSNQRLNSEVAKVDGELYDQEGYRVDVTVWFRHRNENLYYVDSGGNLHGPLDLKHSAKVDGSKKSWESYGRTARTQSSISRRSRSGGRNQSDTNLRDAYSDVNYEYQTKHSQRNRTLSETRTHVGADIDVLLDDLNRMGYKDSPRSQYRSSVTRRVGDSVVVVPTMARWSSLQADGSGNFGHSDAGRYTTTLTRRHVQRNREPVEFLIQKPISAGVSKVNLLSVDNRQSRMDSDEKHERERRLMDELLETRKELHELKRTRSMVAEESRHGLVHPDDRHFTPRREVPLIRATSQRDVHNLNNTFQNSWTSESNIREKYSQKYPQNTYSARRENMREKEGSTKQAEQTWQTTRQDTISLQPIGPGVHDLGSKNVVTTLPRSWSNTAGRSHSFAGGEISPQLRVQNFSNRQSPAMVRQVKTPNEQRSRLMQNDGVFSRSQGLRGSWTGGMGAAPNFVETMDSPNSIFRPKDSTSNWLKPALSRAEAESILLNREPGSFIVRQSRSKPSCFALAVRVSPSPGDGERVRTFLIEQIPTRVSSNPGYHLQGFDIEPVYPSLAALIQDHTVQRGALSVCLRLPPTESDNKWSGNYATRSQLCSSSGELICDVLYLGCCDVYPQENAQAVRLAVAQLLSDANNPRKGLKKKCEATITATPGKGLVICDNTGLRFQKKSIAGNRIRFCNFDPEDRVFNSSELNRHGLTNSQIFAIVVKKTRFAMTEHMAYVMCQLEANQPCSSVVNFVNQNFLGLVR